MEDNARFNVEEGLKRLEEINQKLSGPEITLEESLKLYHEGTQLAAQCKAHLEGVEKKLQIISETGSGEVSIDHAEA